VNIRYPAEKEPNYLIRPQLLDVPVAATYIIHVAQELCPFSSQCHDLFDTSHDAGVRQNPLYRFAAAMEIERAVPDVPIQIIDPARELPAFQPKL
jgi:hypothetical protein